MRLGSHQTEEAKAKQSAVMKGRPTWNKGISPSPAARAKMSLARMGNTNSLGNHCSKETRAKIGIANSNPSLETRAKIGAALWKGGTQAADARKHAKRHALGFVPMNTPFVGCDGHHINDHDVIYIPRVLHQSVHHCVFTGKNMEQINAKVCQWLTEDWT